MFKDIGLEFNVTKIRFIEVLQGKRLPVKVTALSEETGIHRTEVYKIVRYLEKFGLLHVYERDKLSPEEEEHLEQNYRHTYRSSERKTLMRGLRVVLTPKGIIPHLDRRIKELQEFKGKIEAGEVFQSGARLSAKRTRQE